MVPHHQLGYLQALCACAQTAASRARASAAQAELELGDALDRGVQPWQLRTVWQLQREAAQKLHLGVFFARLYVTALQSSGTAQVR